MIPQPQITASSRAYRSMPIRTKPWSEVTLRDVEDLITREIREDATIEFKRQLNLVDRDQKGEFLKDVSAMANAVGGTIIYGAIEGEGDLRGQIIQVQGQALDRDQVELQITNLLRDGLDERLDGVLFKALPTTVAGEYVCVLRIPSSPLAPHRIKMGEKPQFHARGSVSNAPLNTRQIREMILQRSTAIDKALDLIERRTAEAKAAGPKRRYWDEGVAPPDQIILHVIPLFPLSEGWGDPDRHRRLLGVPPLGDEEPYDSPFYAAQGMYIRIEGARHVLFLRAGGIEFQRYDALFRPRQEDAAARLEAWRVELDVLNALEHCKALTEDGLLPLPALISLRILDVAGTGMLMSPGRRHLPIQHLQTDLDVFLTPFVVSAWGEASDQQVRHIFDEMWQAWHFPRCRNYYPDGRHHRYNRAGDVIPADQL
jgi:hypothetical protein